MAWVGLAGALVVSPVDVIAQDDSPGYDDYERNTLQEFFEGFGVEFPDGAKITYYAPTGKLIVRNTVPNLEKTQAVMEGINIPPVFVDISVVFLEISAETGVRWGLDGWGPTDPDTCPLPNEIPALLNERDAIEERGGDGKIVFRAEPAGEFLPGWHYRSDKSLEPEDFVCIRVKDNGRGIAPEIKANIFEPFFTTKRVGKGTGMGLAMAYGCVVNHNGWIHAESQVGKGSEFFVFVPRAKE